MTTLTRTDGETLAYTKLEAPASMPTLVWLSGFNSDMAGSKAQAVKDWAQQNNYGFMAFDYYGHGQSSGEFAKGTISRWREDCLTAIDELTTGPLVLVGSSMGGWMALLTALARTDRVKAMMLIAPAPDFTEKLLWKELPGSAQEDIAHNGFWMRPNEYGEPYPITRELIADGKKWSILDAPIDLTMPVSILQGKMDPDVPWTHALKIQEKIVSTDCDFHLIKDGEHRLSRPEDIARLLTELGILMGRIA